MVPKCTVSIINIMTCGELFARHKQNWLTPIEVRIKRAKNPSLIFGVFNVGGEGVIVCFTEKWDIKLCGTEFALGLYTLALYSIRAPSFGC